MRIAVVSDAHLFQTFAEEYDSVADFERALAQIAEDTNPDVLFMAGDMFDYKKTETVFLRHYEGEGHMMKLREILKRFAKPVYAIRGNHDKEEVLKGLAQTVPNFHYRGSCIDSIEGLAVCFMDSYYETGGIYESATIQRMEHFLSESLAKIGNHHNRRLLLCHETFEPYENAIPDKVVKIMKENFAMVLNGHMHSWNPRTYNSSNVVCLPSLLPSKIVKGKYAMERYTWSGDEQNPALTELESPFGYTILDSDSFKVEVHPFAPSKRVIEISINTTGLSLEEARRRLREVLASIDGRNDKSALIILPCIEGTVSFSPIYLNSVRSEFPELVVEEVRFSGVPLTTALGSVTLEAPMLSIDQLFEKLNADVPKLVEDMLSKGVAVDEKTVRKALDVLLGEELIIKSQTIAQNRVRLQVVLAPIIEAMTGEKALPPNFQDNMSALLKAMR